MAVVITNNPLYCHHTNNAIWKLEFPPTMLIPSKKKRTTYVTHLLSARCQQRQRLHHLLILHDVIVEVSLL